MFLEHQAVEVVELDTAVKRGCILPTGAGSRPPQVGDTGIVVDIPAKGAYTVEGFLGGHTIWVADFREYELRAVGPIAFRVEHVTQLQGRTYVFARWLGGKTFSVLPGARLAGVPIDPFLEIPRKLDSEGKPVFDVFAFRLTDNQDAGRFPPGAEIELTTS